ADPGEPVLIAECGRRPNHLSVVFCDKTAQGAAVEEPVPVDFGLIPAGDRAQAHSTRNIFLGHFTKSHERSPEACSIPESQRRPMRILSTIPQAMPDFARGNRN